MSNILPASFPASTDRSIASDGLIARGAEEDDEEEEEEDKKDKDDDSEDEGDGYSESTCSRRSLLL